MARRWLLLPILAGGALLPSCASTTDRVVELEGFTFVTIDVEAGPTAGGGVSGTFDFGDYGFGGRVALDTEYADLVGQARRRYGDDVRVSEYATGLRKRFSAKRGYTVEPYVRGLYKFGNDIDEVDGEKYDDGIAIGIGLLMPLSEHSVLSIGLDFETTFGRFSNDDADSLMQGALLTVGFGPAW